MTDQPIEVDAEVFKKTGKYNTSVRLTEEDKKAGVKIYCQEPYAQELYDIMQRWEKGEPTLNSKDLISGSVYRVTAKQVSHKDSLIYAEELNSGATILIPFREYSDGIEDLIKSNDPSFYVMLYKTNAHGENFGSEKKALAVSYKYELFDHLKENTWFEVTIIKLIKGGYLALYNREVECFIPGSHAAANVVHNFNEMLGKTLTVMVDNYDQSNDLFILSHKKYINYSMPVMIENLQFNKSYTGTLTNRPYDFGAFVEVEEYFTGLIHSSEFEDYEKAKSSLKTGDKLEVYVKDITSKKGQYRIVFTLSPENTNTEKLAWQRLRERTENRSFSYTVDLKNNSIAIEIDGESFPVALKRKDLEKNVSLYPYVKVSKVDPINKNLKFEFTEEFVQ
jgi:ribosomal protein S1